MQQFPAKHSIPQMAQRLYSPTMTPVNFSVYLMNYMSINELMLLSLPSLWWLYVRESERL